MGCALGPSGGGRTPENQGKRATRMDETEKDAAHGLAGLEALLKAADGRGPAPARAASTDRRGAGAVMTPSPCARTNGDRR